MATRPAVGWGLALRWALASTLGWAVILSLATLGQVGTLLWPLLLLVPGVLQWLVLRRRVPQPGWWAVASAAGLLLGTYLATSRQLLDLYLARRDQLDSLLAYSTLGATLGLAQWLVLRRWSPQAHWWILANMLAWPIGWAMGAALGALLSWPWMVGIEPVWTASIAGLATGVVLAWLLPATSRV